MLHPPKVHRINTMQGKNSRGGAKNHVDQLIWFLSSLFNSPPTGSCQRRGKILRWTHHFWHFWGEPIIFGIWSIGLLASLLPQSDKLGKYDICMRLSKILAMTRLVPVRLISIYKTHISPIVHPDHDNEKGAGRCSRHACKTPPLLLGPLSTFSPPIVTNVTNVIIIKPMCEQCDNHES